MLDHFTRENVDVRFDPVCGSYIMIEPARLGRVQEVLKENEIPFAVEDGARLACKGTPEAAVVEFGKDTDPERIQQVLDSIQ